MYWSCSARSWRLRAQWPQLDVIFIPSFPHTFGGRPSCSIHAPYLAGCQHARAWRTFTSRGTLAHQRRFYCRLFLRDVFSLSNS